MSSPRARALSCASDPSVYACRVTASFDPAKFRQVLGHVPTSVVVVTGIGTDGKPYGITIGSFVSVSLEPALVGFLPGLNSHSWQAIAASGKFCVNVQIGRAHV